MSKLKSPSITIIFRELGATAIDRGERGVVGLVIEDSTAAVYTVNDTSDIPTTLSDENQQLILDALKGYSKAPTRIIVYVMVKNDDMADTYKAMEKYFETTVVDYLAITTVETESKAEEIATWVKSMRDNNHSKVKAVLPNYGADNEGVIDWCTTLKRNVTSTDSDGNTTTTQVDVTPEKGCARIAGLLAGTAISISATYAPLTDFADCERMSKEDADAAVGAGKLVAIWDGEKVKLNRAVNSFVTTTAEKKDSFKKIKIVEAMDLMQTDIRKTIEDSYIGKYPNTYDNKCLLITAINAYFDGLVADNVLQAGLCSINTAKQKTYLKGIGKPVVLDDGTEKALSACSDDEINKANTGSHVFLKATVSILDAIEDVDLDITI